MSDKSLWSRVGEERDGLELEVFVQPAVNLALVHNSVPIINAIRVRNNSTRAQVDVQVVVTLHRDGELLADEWTRVHDGELGPDEEVIWTDFGAVHPTQQHLAGLNESYPAALRVIARRSWGDECSLAVPLHVLAHNEWFNAPIFYSSLAAFVQPNTRAVEAVLRTASDLLGASTGDSSLGGYQSGRTRAGLLAAAIYESLRRRDLRYIDPPASFEETGQKVRTPTDVLASRLGTCLDFSVAYAACLEQAGLRPVIGLAAGHAFAGFMAEDEPVESSVIAEPNAMANLVHSGRLVPVEAAFYGHDREHGFKAAVAAATARFEQLDELRALVAVSVARREGVRPLPSQDDIGTLEPSGSPTLAPAVSDPLELPDTLLERADPDGAVFDPSDESPARVRQWKRSLLDLSTRNRLLNLRASAQVFDLHVPADGLPEFEDIVHAGKPVTLRASDDLGDLAALQGVRRAQDVDQDALRHRLTKESTVHVQLTEQRYPRALKGLQRTARMLREETGNANLYLTFGALVHKTASGAEARAPLFLVPARLDGGTGRAPFRVSVDVANTAAPNHCLVQWLRLKHGVRIPALETPALDQSGLDIEGALRDIRGALLQHRLDVRIDAVATLAICQFSTLGMWRDLVEHWETLTESPVVRHLVHHAGESFRDPAAAAADGLDVEVDESELAVPIPADGSQLEAIALAGRGRSFVLEGPPGTGKSQTITNLIAHALDRGKTVLFVAEKQAALDVVKRRLDAVGLGAFALDLHGQSQQPRRIREQLKHAIEQQSEYEQRGWQAALARFRGRHAVLEDYPAKVHGRNGLDWSLWSAAAHLLQIGVGPTATITAEYVERPVVEEAAITEAIETFARLASGVSIAELEMWALASVVPDAATLGNAVNAALRALEQVAADPDATALADGVDDPSELRALVEVLDGYSDVEALSPEEAEAVRSPAWQRRKRELSTLLADYRATHDVVLGMVTPAFAVDGDLADLVELAEAAQSGFLRRRKREARFADASTGVTRSGEPLGSEAALRIKLQLEAAREHATRVVVEVRDLVGERLPRSWSPMRDNANGDLDATFEALERGLQFEREHAELASRIQSGGRPARASVAALSAAAVAIEQLRILLVPHREDEQRWGAGRSWREAWTAGSRAWSASLEQAGDRRLRRWVQLSSSLESLRAAGLVAFRLELLSGEIQPEVATEAFLRGIASASVSERLDAGRLEGFVAAVKNGEIDDFADASAALREEQRTALPDTMLRRRSFQAGKLAYLTGELRRALDATRGGLTFRQLMERHGELILEATPCMFVSPASLAQFVPPGSVTFDLVVFDEASQVTVAQSVGALGRGRAAVIVGDSQQMPPTAVGQATVSSTDEDDGDEQAPPEDLESILTESKESGLPSLWLSWHYRSQDEALIAFSNQHYYDGKLASLPSPGGDPHAGVEWRRVDGHFNREDKRKDHRTNRVEADGVVEEIRFRLADPVLSGESIGVVTFNSQQRDLILNLLEATQDSLVAAQLRPEAVDGLFVKNLENVQGDERDVILFSTAFSKKPDGSPLPMNFGPISRQGGEKRLNVAVTRARRKVVMFTSFDPIDIDLSRTSARGMADLRAYIEMANRGADGSAQRRETVGRDVVAGSIADQLREMGFEAQVSYGLSEFSLDLVVRAAGAATWQVAVVLDGPVWRERRTVTDRDVMPRLLDSMMSWGAVERIWLPAWLDDPRAVLSGLSEAVERAQEREAARAKEIADAAARRAADLEAIRVAEELAAAEAERVDAEEDAVIDGHSRSAPVLEPETSGGGAAPYVIDYTKRSAKPEPVRAQAVAEPDRLEAAVETEPAPQPVSIARDFERLQDVYCEAPATALGERADLDRTHSPWLRQRIMQAIREVVEAEGPIAADRLARSIARRFGFDRVPSARSEFILSLVPSDRRVAGPLGEFVWPTQLHPATWRGYRATTPGTSRPVKAIAPEEIINVMVHVAQASTVDDEELLLRETLRIFAQTKLTQASSERLRSCLELALSTGRITDDGGRYRAGA